MLTVLEAAALQCPQVTVALHCYLGTSAGIGGVNQVNFISVLTPAESSLSVPCPETPLMHFFLPDCSVPALTRLICTPSPAAHVCHYSDEAVTC